MKVPNVLAHLVEIDPGFSAPKLAELLDRTPPAEGNPGRYNGRVERLVWYHDLPGYKSGTMTIFVPQEEAQLVSYFPAGLLTRVAVGAYRSVRGAWYLFRPKTSSVPPPYLDEGHDNSQKDAAQ